MRQNVFDIVGEEFTSQGSTYGTKALAFFCKNPNKEADRLGLSKDGRSGRGNHPAFRTVDNAKCRSRHAVTKKNPTSK